MATTPTSIGADTSSYPKYDGKGFLDTAHKFQTLEQGQIGIDQHKLALANERMTQLSKGLSQLIADPNLTPEKIETTATMWGKQLGIPPAMQQQFLQQFPTNGTPEQLRQKLHEVMVKNQSINEAINLHYGIQSPTSDGQRVTPGVFSPKPGFGQRSTNLPIQQQPSVSQPVMGPGNIPMIQGPTPPVLTPGSVAAPPMAPGFSLPVAPPPASGPAASPNVQPQSQSLPVAPTGAVPGSAQMNVNSRFPAPSGPQTGVSPLFNQGLARYDQDQDIANKRMFALKPMAQAYQLMQAPGFLSGPGTETFTRGVAALKTWGLIDTAAENDPTAIRQEVSKKLAAYLSGSPVGQRSDAAQLLTEASNPNPKQQILPALIKLTKDAIVLDRVQYAMPNAFTKQDYENYIKHRGTFPQSIDERAFSLDLEKDGGAKLVQEMGKKYKSQKSTKDWVEADKFFRSLDIANNTKVYN